MLQLLPTGAVRRRIEFWLSLLGCGLLLASCTEDPTRPAGPAGPGPKAEALYGSSTTAAASFIPRAPMRLVGDTNWSKAPFYFIQTELSPAVLYHSDSNYLGLFTGLAESVGARSTGDCLNQNRNAEGCPVRSRSQRTDDGSLCSM